MAMIVSVSVVVIYRRLELALPLNKNMRRKRTMQKQDTDYIQTKAHTAHDKNQLWIFDTYIN